jgi:hypothetical protein
MLMEARLFNRSGAVFRHSAEKPLLVMDDDRHALAGYVG